jgi:hypothetical protein
MHTSALRVNVEGRIHFEEVGEDGTVILKWIMEWCDGRARTGSILFGFGPSGWILCSQ